MNDYEMEYMAIELRNDWVLLQNTASENLLAFFHPDMNEIFVAHDFFETGTIVFRAKMNDDDTLTILVLDDSIISLIDFEEKQIRIDEVEVLAELEEEY
ncbi:hypothetical protein [Bacillus sp. 1P06AnD]|uniref:hypothetical protein n=1 Tax=Bacillus sp. 1P06AnD TaxID=3132208 RepID=UPI00399F37AF